MNELIIAAVAASGVALVLSVINTMRISALKKKSEVDLVNQQEDVNLSMESVKFTVSREVKNLRKELNKRTRPANPQPKKPNNPQNKPKADGDKDTKDLKEGEVKKPRRNYRKPPYKPRKKPVENKDVPPTAE